LVWTAVRVRREPDKELHHAIDRLEERGVKEEALDDLP